jgi:hypothetical protein
MRDGLFVEKDKVARAMKSAPIVVAEETAVESIDVGRFDQNEAGRRKKLSHGTKDRRGIGDMLDQIEH